MDTKESPPPSKIKIKKKGKKKSTSPPSGPVLVDSELSIPKNSELPPSQLPLLGASLGIFGMDVTPLKFYGFAILLLALGLIPLWKRWKESEEKPVFRAT